MAAIKPGLMNIFLERYDKRMIKEYLLRTKHANFDVNNDSLKRRKSMLRSDSSVRVSVCGSKPHQNNFLSDQKVYELEKMKYLRQKEQII